MSKISKALDKYKKEHNLTSNQVYNLENSKNAKKYRPPQNPKRSLNDDERPKGVPDPAQKPIHAIKPAHEDRRVSTPSLTKETAELADATAEQGPMFSTVTPVALRPTSRFAPDLVSIVNPGSIEAELFKVLRGKILFPTLGKPPKSILITSAAPGEGKSFIASNLAVNLAHGIENHVLLLDCDIRRPTIHKLFGFGEVDGLSEHLSNGIKWTSLLIESGVDKLNILPSGKSRDNPAELLSSDKMATLIEDIKNQYEDRFLIIDSPPPLLAPETVALSKHVDGIIVVIKYSSTPLHVVEELIENLGREKILGAVVNQFNSRISSKHYGYGKYIKDYRKTS